MKWKSKLPLIVIIMHVGISLPFYLGLVPLSTHDSIYSILYLMVNLPVEWIVLLIFLPLHKYIVVLPIFWEDFFAIFSLTIVWGSVAMCAGIFLDKLVERANKKARSF